ncbi:MAG: tetratricopeptide repeat protein [Candidatus Heimdallarchaeota archaeon]
MKGDRFGYGSSSSVYAYGALIKSEREKNFIDMNNSNTPLPDFVTKAREFRLKGELDEAFRILEENMKSVSNDQREIRIDSLNEHSFCLTLIGENERAERQATQALELADNQPQYLKGQADACHVLGTIFTRQGRFALADDFLHKGLTLREQLESPIDIAASLLTLGVLSRYENDYDKAETYYSRSMELCEETGNMQGLGSALGNLLSIHSFRGDLDKAEEAGMRALTISRGLEHSAREAGILTNLGQIKLRQKKYNDAEHYFQEGLTVSHLLNDPLQSAVLLNGLGEVHYRQNDLDQAEEYYRRSYGYYQKVGNPSELAIGYYYLIRLYIAKGLIAEALTELEQLAQIAKHSNLPDIQIHYLLAQAQIKVHKLDWETALALSTQAEAMAAEIPLFELIQEAQELIATIKS